MDTQTYSSIAIRSGNQKGKILKHSVPVEVLGITGVQHKMERNMSDTIVFGRYIPHGGATTNYTTQNRWTVTAAAHQTVEGVTPDADTLSRVDITVQMQQYSCLYVYTDKAKIFHEDDLPAAQIKHTGQRMGLVREMIRYGALKGTTHKYYCGGTTRATVDEAISLNVLRNVTRNISGNHGMHITTVLKASPLYDTHPIEAGFLVFCHTDMMHDIRELPNFTPCIEYASGRQVHPKELGSVDEFRFIVSPDLGSIIDSGAAVGVTGLKSTGNSNIDVYPMVVVADEAWGDVALRGENSFEPIHIQRNREDKSDPLKQRGYIGAIFWSAMFIQNDGWMAVVESGATELDS